MSVEESIKSGNLSELAILISKGSRIPRNSCMLACERDDLDMLIYLSHMRREHDLIWDERVLGAAAVGNSLRCLKYAHENGCQFTSQNISENYMTYTVCETACLRGNLDILKYSVENHCVYYLPICKVFAKNEEIIKYLQTLE